MRPLAYYEVVLRFHDINSPGTDLALPVLWIFFLAGSHLMWWQLFRGGSKSKDVRGGEQAGVPCKKKIGMTKIWTVLRPLCWQAIDEELKFGGYTRRLIY